MGVQLQISTINSVKLAVFWYGIHERTCVLQNSSSDTFMSS